MGVDVNDIWKNNLKEVKQHIILKKYTPKLSDFILACRLNYTTLAKLLDRYGEFDPTGENNLAFWYSCRNLNFKLISYFTLNYKIKFQSHFNINPMLYFKGCYLTKLKKIIILSEKHLKN